MKPTNNSWTPPGEQPKVALISVWDKTGIETFAQALIDEGWTILSSGGTAKALKAAGIQVTDTEEITGLKAMLSHRVATLHPVIHGGLLATKSDEHLAEMEKHKISWIAMVVVDFYPLKDEVNREGATTESVIKETDIGGPTMIRSGVKGQRIVICDPKDRMPCVEWLKAGAPESAEVVSRLGAKAEFTVSEYCMLAATFHSKGKYAGSFHKNEKLNSEIFQVTVQ